MDLLNWLGITKMTFSKLLPISLISLCVGCVSMYSHQKFNEEQVKFFASSMALSIVCGNRDYTPFESAITFGHSLKQLYSVSIYDEDLYEDFYTQNLNYLSNADPAFLKRECDKLNTKIASMTQRVQNIYLDTVNKRNAQMGLAANTLQEGGNQALWQTSQIKVQPNLTPNASMNDPSSVSHYLVQTREGTVQCAITDSGYVNCR